MIYKTMHGDRFTQEIEPPESWAARRQAAARTPRSLSALYGVGRRSS